MIPDLFERGHTDLCRALEIASDEDIEPQLTDCTCRRPYAARLTPGSEWVVGHTKDCEYRSGSITPCTCGFAGLRVYDLPVGLLGLVVKGELYRKCRKSSAWFLIENHDGDAPWRDAWERFVSKWFGDQETDYRTEDIPDGLVVLSDPGSLNCKHCDRGDGWHDYDKEHPCDHCNPHSLPEPTLLRVAERMLSPIGPLFTSAWDCSPLNALSDHFNRFDHHALLFERGGSDAVRTGDLENLRVVRRELLP